MFSRLKDRLYRLHSGWVVVVTLSIIGVILAGIPLSFGVFFKSIGNEFGLTRATTSAVTSTYMVIGTAFAILGGWALDRYGPRIIVLLMGLFTGLSMLLTSQTSSLWQLFITYSLLLPVGVSCVYVVIISTVSRWFYKKRGLALGIAGSGNGLGAVIIAPLATYLLASLGWRTAYLVLGLITWFIVIPLSRLLKRDPAEIGALPYGVTTVSRDILVKRPETEGQSIEPPSIALKQAFRTRSFWLITTTWLLFGACMLFILIHLVPHITDMGFSPVEAATVLSLLGVATLTGRLLMGIVSDRIGMGLTASICALTMAGAIVSLVWLQDLWMFYIFALIYGFAFGGIDPGLAGIIGETFGLRSIGLILGVFEACFRIGAAIGSAAGGLIFDITGSYSTAFFLGALSMLIGALLIALVRRETGEEV